MANTPALNMPLLTESQTGKELDHNEAIYLLDVFVAGGVIDRDLTTPPVGPSEGDAYIPASGATGAWGGKVDNVAVYINGVWVFVAPFDGLRVWVIDEARLLLYTGTAWALQEAVEYRVAIVTLGGTTHTATGANEGSLLVFDSASPCTLTLPQASTEALPAGYQIMVRNKGSGTLTLAKEGSDTIENGTIINDPNVPTSVILETAGSPNNWVVAGDAT